MNDEEFEKLCRKELTDFFSDKNLVSIESAVIPKTITVKFEFTNLLLLMSCGEGALVFLDMILPSESGGHMIVSIDSHIHKNIDFDEKIRLKKAEMPELVTTFCKYIKEHWNELIEIASDPFIETYTYPVDQGHTHIIDDLEDKLSSYGFES